MELEELIGLVARGESEIVEFKETVFRRAKSPNKMTGKSPNKTASSGQWLVDSGKKG